MTSATGLSACYIIASILLSIGTKGTAYGATAMVFIFQIFLGIGYLPIVSIFTLSIIYLLVEIYDSLLCLHKAMAVSS